MTDSEGLSTDRSDTSDNVHGAQSVQRAVAILRLVAQSGQDGCRASEIASFLDLNLATTERLLRALMQEHLVERDAATRHYRIGPEIVALGATRLQRFSLTHHFEPALTQIAAESGDTAFLWVRSGDEAVCLARREGGYPIRALAVEVGDRRPLGVGAGPLAQLAFMADAYVQRILIKQARSYSTYGLTPNAVKAMVDRSRTLGFAMNEGQIIPEMGSVGLPISNMAGDVVASISVAAISARMHQERAAHIADIVRSAIASLTPVPDR